MTYKSIKFHQSPVARSLEQLAIQKGLFQPQSNEAPVIKTAAAEVAPKSFPEKLLKLCDGLRSKGFVAYANQLETQFLLLKKAEADVLVKRAAGEVHLYNVHGEEGKDLIEFAHPEHNKKLDKSWNDLGVIENVLEKHDKILAVVNKQPKGKLASKNIVNAVKIVLAEEDDISFLGNGRAKASGKQSLAQEAPNPLANIGEQAGATAGVVGGLALVKWLYSRLLQAKGPENEAVKMLAQRMGRKITDAEAKNLAKQVLEKNMKDVVDSVGKETAQAAAKEVGADVTEVAAESAVAGEAAAGGAAGAFGTAPVMGLWAIVGSAAAVVGSAIGGGLLGSHLFESQFFARNLAQAGNNLLEELNDLESDLHGQDAEYASDFKDGFSQIMALIPKAMTMKQKVTQENVDALEQLDEQIGRTMHTLSNLMGTARQHIDKGWTPEILSGWRSMELRASDFSNILSKTNTDVVKLMNQMKAKAAGQQQADERQGSPIGQQNLDFANMVKHYSDLLQQWKATVNNDTDNTPEDKQKANEWIDAMTGQITELRGRFDGLDAAEADKQATAYLNELHQMVQGFGQFHQVWIGQ